jgi:hypothetical protein
LLLAILAATALSLGAGACSSGGTPRSQAHAPARPAASPDRSSTDLATLPQRTAPGGGPGYHVIASARGTGDRAVGTFPVTRNARLIIQMTCDGPPPLTINGLLATGPCDNGDLVTTDITTAAGNRLPVVVRASAKLRWAIYIVQRG